MPDVAILYGIHARTNKTDCLLEQPSRLILNSIVHAAPSSELENSDIEYYYVQNAPIVGYDLIGML